jgi:putative tRNA adenosine deaminase-associated protein
VPHPAPSSLVAPVDDDLAAALEELEASDFAVAAHREDGVWHVAALSGRAQDDLSALRTALLQRPPHTAPLALVAVDDDFWVAVRARGHQLSLLLSDVTAALEWPIAREVLDALEEPLPDDDEPRPIGDLGLFSDLGLRRPEMVALCEDEELYPDEVCLRVAGRLGFAPQLVRVLRAAGGPAF